MRILILGAGSFGGRAAVDGFLTIPGACILGIGRSNFPELEPFLESNSEKFQYLVFDLNKDFDALLRKIEEFEPDEVVDFLGQGMVAESFLSPEDWYLTNVVNKARLYNHFLKLKKVPRLTRISTPEVFGACKLTPDSDYWNFRPSTPYAVSHAAIDSHVRVLGEYKGLRFQVLRFANFYGPGQQLYRLIPKAGLFALLGKKFPLHGGGLSERAFIFRNDIASAVVAALKHGEQGGVYHFRGSGYFSIRDVVEMIATTLNVSYERFVVMDEERLAKDAGYEMDISQARQVLHWNPSVDLNTGVESVMGWITQNVDTLSKLPAYYQHKK